MKNLRLWEQYTAEMMHAMIDQTFKQTDAIQKQMEENTEQLLQAWPTPFKSPLNGLKYEEPAGQAADHAQKAGPEPGEEEGTGPVEKPQESGHSCPEPVWSFRGYQLEAGNFTNAMVHFFRAESYRADSWRRRLDTTTNWAVITTGATLSLAWDPRVIILSTLLITLFLFIEARRYRHYELWSYRVRLMETDFFAAMLAPPFRPAPDWAESLAENLLRPNFPISMWEAFGRRFRRNYVWIYTILWLAWLLSIWLHPTTATSWSEFTQRAAIGVIPAWVVLLVGVVFNGALIVTGLATRRLHQAAGEVFPPEEIAETGPAVDDSENKNCHPAWQAWFRPSRRRKQSVAFIITDAPQTVAASILKEMRRGVTSLAGTGMYSGQNHNVLVCALTVTEIERLKSVVAETDPKAFVMVSPAHQIMGAGFAPLQAQQS